MSHNHRAELLFLLGCSTLTAACEENGGEHQDEVEAAVDACLPIADLTTECSEEDIEPYYLTLVGSCVATLGYADADGTACRGAYEDYFACLAELECDEITGADADPCSEQEAAIENECDFDEFSEDSGDDDDGSSASN